MRDDKYWLEDAQNELVYIQQELQKIIKDINKLQKEQGPNSANRMANWLIKKNECRQRELQEKHDRLSIHIKSYNDPKAKQKTYEEDLQKELANNLYNNLMFGTVFVGLVLLCLPGTQLAAILLISIAVGMFLYKHRPTSGNEFNAFKNIVDTKIETSAEPKNVGSDDDEGESTSFLDDDGLNF